jgi:phospholipid/cholesterol/gamma-HCH transport system substrate-binding protein
MADIKKQLQWSKLKVGSVITLALLILLVTVFFAGNIEELFLKKVELKTHFKDVKGLRRGAPVWVYGTEVGSVRDIDLDPKVGTIVTMKLNKSALPFIKEDSTAGILTMGLLGDKYIEIGTGSPEARPVRPGETIEGAVQIEFQDVMKTSSVTIETMSGFIKKLDGFVTKIEEGQGTFAKLLNDPSLYNNLNKTSQTLSLVAEEIRTAQGTLKKLIDDPSLYQKLEASASNLQEMTRIVKESSGTFKKLIEDPTLYNKILESASHVEASSKKLEAFSGKLESFGTKLNDSQGSLKKFIEDPTLYNDLNKGAKQVSAILEEIDKGQGLATAFLKNKELARELSETLVQLKKMTEDIEELAKDIKANPKKYLKFSVF